MEENKIQYTKSEDIGTILYIAINNEYKGLIIISDEIKEDSKGLVKNLKNLGVKKTVMLTGDKKTVGEDVGEKLRLDEVYTELLPDGKVKKVEKLMQEKTEKGKQNTDPPHAEGFYIKSVLCFSKPIKDSFGDNHQSIKWLGERDNTQHAGTNLNHTAALGKKSHQGSCHKKQDNTTNTH